MPKIKNFTIMSFLLLKLSANVLKTLTPRAKQPEPKRNDFDINFRVLGVASWIVNSSTLFTIQDATPFIFWLISCLGGEMPFFFLVIDIVNCLFPHAFWHNQWLYRSVYLVNVRGKKKDVKMWCLQLSDIGKRKAKQIAFFTSSKCFVWFQTCSLPLLKPT